LSLSVFLSNLFFILGHGKCICLLEQPCPDDPAPGGCDNEMSMAEVYASVFEADLSLTRVTQTLGELTSCLSSTLNISTPSFLSSPNCSYTSQVTPTSCPSTSSQAGAKVDTSSIANSPPTSPSTAWDSAGRGGKLATPTTLRRKLFDVAGKENVGGRARGVSLGEDKPPTSPGSCDLSATILLEEYKENLCASQEAAGGGVNNGCSPVLQGEAAKEKSLVIPADILKLSDAELRKKLVSLGERPGPIVNSTRLAYQSYLSKLLAGIQPSGNSGYKCRQTIINT